MGKGFVFTETVITSIEPKRAFKTAEECLVDLRLVENRKEAFAWVYEYEVSGEMGKIAKFLGRIKGLESIN